MTKTKTNFIELADDFGRTPVTMKQTLERVLEIDIVPGVPVRLDDRDKWNEVMAARRYYDDSPPIIVESRKPGQFCTLVYPPIAASMLNSDATLKLCLTHGDYFPWVLIAGFGLGVDNWLEVVPVIQFLREWRVD